MGKTMAEYEAENAALRAQLAKAAAPRTIHFKVGEKGGVSVYGLNAKFPQTNYLEQWRRFIGHEDVASDLGVIPELKAFIKAHRAELKLKDGTKAAA